MPGKTTEDVDILYQQTTSTSINPATEQTTNNVQKSKTTVASSVLSQQTLSTATIPTTNNAKVRKYDKKYSCMFCNRSYAKLPRHLKEVHKDEDYVIEYMGTNNKKSKNKILQKIRNIGSHLHNKRVLTSGKGQLCVRYRPSKRGTCIEEFSPCPYCLGYFRTKELWRHKCQYKPEEGGIMRIGVASKLLLPNQPGTSDHLHTILSTMRSDPVSRIVKSDDTIRLFGEKLCNKHAHDSDQHNYIRQKLRELARLVEELRIKDDAPDKYLKDYIDPAKYRIVVSACKSLSSFDHLSNKYRTPSLALKLGHSLRKCSKLLLGLSIEHGKKDQHKKAEEFITLLQMNWGDDVSSNAIRSLHEAKKNSGRIIPLAEDVATLTKYLKSASTEEYNILLNSEDEALRMSWIRLAKILLVVIITFNRRRAGGVSKMKLSEFDSVSKTSVNDAVEGSLSKLEQKLSRSFYRLEITAKRGNIVPILLTKEMKKTS